MTGRRYLLTPLVALSLAAFSASSAQSAAPTKVGNGWDFTHYFVADWTADGTPDLVVRDSQGDLLLYPFKNNTFYNAGGPFKVGDGWDFTDYFVADWLVDGTPDLVVRSNEADLLLYPFKNNAFYNAGGPFRSATAGTSLTTSSPIGRETAPPI